MTYAKIPMAVSKTRLFNHTDHAFGASYPISLPAFEGPLDLLLHLIERRELDVSEVSLMAVTEAYLQTMSQLEELVPGALADFLVIASRLLYIKSRALLPKPPALNEDEEEEDPDALVRQLLEYRRFKEIAEHLRERTEAGLRVYVRTAPRPEVERHLELGNVELAMLHRAVQRALARIPNDPPAPAVHTYPITVAEQIGKVRRYIRHVHAMIQARADGASPVTFSGLLGRSTSRMEVVVTFLAVLELIKQRELAAVQQETFGEIELTPLEELVADAAPESPR
jgi:segregation and condensation protein A